MRKDQRVAIIQKILNERFPEPAIPLKHRSAYTLLIAVLLSARCTDARVNIITPKLFDLASTPEKMVQLPVSVIQSIIRPCGLSPQKAQRIHDLSQILIDQYASEVPACLEALEQLPGVGHKTASVVLAQAFHIPAFPVDTHIYRSARRWRLSKARSIQGVEADLKKCFASRDWIRVHLQMIYYARAFCPARGHKIDQCPICSSLN